MVNWLIKLAQHQDVKIEKGIHTQSQSEIYYLTGNTYPFHKAVNLKTLGFQWWAARQMWWMYAQHMSKFTIEKLANLGVDTTVYIGRGQQQPAQSAGTVPLSSSTENTTPSSMGQPPASQIATNAQQPDNLVDKSWDNITSPTPNGIGTNYDNERISKKAGFPVKTIYSQDISIEFEGKPVVLTLNLLRRAKIGVTGRDAVAKGWNNVPVYSVQAILKATGANLFTTSLPINRDETQPKRKWNTINESAELVPLMESTVAEIFKNEKSKGSGILRAALNLQSRDPELSQMLNDYDKFGPVKKSLIKTIHLNAPGYEGDYPVNFHTYGNREWYGEASLEHPLAPKSYRNIFRFVLPSSIQTIDQFNQWFEQQFNNPEAQTYAQGEYLKYLQSFPFLQQEQDQSKEQFEEIKKLIDNQSMDVTYFRNKLLQMGYIRPSKRMKRGLGMVPQDKVTMIMDTNKILDDIYKFGKTSNSPQFFYAAIAYYMHRLKAGNIGFAPTIIMDSMRQLSDTLKRFGSTIDRGDLEDYIASLAKGLLQSLFGLRSSTAWDNWQSFYGGNWGNENDSNSAPIDSGSSFAMNSFIRYAVMHGFDENMVKQNPHNIYKQLAIKLHPDQNMQNPDQAEADFKELQRIWNSVPEQFKGKQANYNWFMKLACQ